MFCWVHLFLALVLTVVLSQHTSASISTPDATQVDPPKQPLKFYIYDYGEWINISKLTETPRNPTERMHYVLNGGAGLEVSAAEGAYHTNQYQLYNNIVARAMKDPRRTLDPEEATTFVIPYDLAGDAATYIGCPKNKNTTCYDFLKCPTAPRVGELLAESKYYRRRGGLDHLLLVGLNYAMGHYLGKPKCKAFLAGVCTNCTKFAIDDYSFHWADGVEHQGGYWHAAPFPSDFHFNKGIRRPLPWEQIYRPYLVSYIGSTKSYSGQAHRVKASLAHFCALHSVAKLCYHSAYSPSLADPRSVDYNASFHPYVPYREAIFCFQPMGDMPTRKGLFDGILQGCIPVVFDSLSAPAMYTWHWEEEFWNAVVVSIPVKQVEHRLLDPVEYLRDYLLRKPDEVARKQELLRSRVFELQYSIHGPYEVPPLLMPEEEPAQARADMKTSEDAAGAAAVAARGTGESPATGEADSGARGRAARRLRKKKGGSGSASEAAAGAAPLATPSTPVNPRAYNGTYNAVVYPEHRWSNKGTPHSTWPLCGTGMNTQALRPCRDAYDIVMELTMGWHSGTGVPDVRVGSVPDACWGSGVLDKRLNRCVHPPKPAPPAARARRGASAVNPSPASLLSAGRTDEQQSA